MQAIENSATAASGIVKTVEQRSVETLNLVVVGMISVFAAVMLSTRWSRRSPTAGPSSAGSGSPGRPRRRCSAR
ncbi:hypothetical protein [Actinophytocola gossypii]|uniref:hypothetical protein n=1 Tax=Actinophytocola gossypii TaxID=2812003 RepID=UPI0021A53343|nr:hypothetical protein [Actinophytocola gossypii]